MQVCKAIPKGKVATYGTLAALTKSSPRAVGQVCDASLCSCHMQVCNLHASADIHHDGACLQALKKNPFAPEVPCHRVVASTLKIGGFQGDWVRTPCGYDVPM